MNKPKKNGLLWGALGTLFVILGVVVFVVVSSLITRLFIGVRFGDEIACAQMSLTIVGIVVSFLLYEAIFITWQLKLTKDSTKEGDEGGSMSRLLKIVAVSAVCLSLLFAVVSANTFTEFRPDSISKVFFVTTKEYEWKADDNDVRSYTFVCNESGAMSFSVTMWDGETIDVLGGVTSVSDTFRDEYDAGRVDLLKYCAHLAEEFNASQQNITIQCNISDSTVKNAKDHYENDETKALIWEQVEIILAAANAK